MAHQLVPLDIDIQGIEETYKEQGKESAKEYLSEITRDDIAKMKAIGKDLEGLIQYVKWAKEIFRDEISEEVQEKINQILDQLREYKRKLLAIDEDVQEENLKLVINSLQKKDLRGLLQANQGQVFHKFFEEICILLDELRDCFV